eukprot:664502-Pelagomonas_calceolata.AAC.8
MVAMYGIDPWNMVYLQLVQAPALAGLPTMAKAFSLNYNETKAGLTNHKTQAAAEEIKEKEGRDTLCMLIMPGKP